MKTVDQITAEILRREGGFVDDPDDPGGATKFGVTIHTLRRVGLDLDGDGDIDTSDVKALSLAQAGEIFRRDYFDSPRIARLPRPLWGTVYDMNVHAGGASIRLLQGLLNRLGATLAEDGAIGPRTAAAATRMADEIGGEVLRDAYGIERRAFYYRLADARPASRKYVRRRDGGKGGWIKRAEEFLAAQWHFSLADHRERTRTWD